tara:strand:+ start:605 stop:1108 length:504 start_codon:yes stop_codon:yes gene_type:complete
MPWKTIEHPGYFGTSRDEIHTRYNQQFGQDNWRISWQWGSQVIEKPDALQIYEDGYYKFFKSNKDVLNWLVSTASDVYDTAPTNIQAGFSYSVQETINNPIHDVAIRRAVLRNGVLFIGDHLMEVRPNKEGEKLGPHLIPFHLPDMIYRGKIKYKGEDRDFSTNPPW